MKTTSAFFGGGFPELYVGLSHLKALFNRALVNALSWYTPYSSVIAHQSALQSARQLLEVTNERGADRNSGNYSQ